MGVLEWFRVAQSEMDAVIHDARRLRAQYGLEAERWCEVGLVSTVGDPQRRRALKQLQRALKHT